MRGEKIGGGQDFEALGFDAAAGEFDGGDNGHGFDRPHAVEVSEVFELEIDAFLVGDADDVLGEGHDVNLRGAFAQ